MSGSATFPEPRSAFLDDEDFAALQDELKEIVVRVRALDPEQLDRFVFTAAHSLNLAQALDPTELAPLVTAVRFASALRYLARVVKKEATR
ncbi:hypothetical protein UFOVP1383_58 [uncultured Caudovirales phage]|uniref:Uncharacterized protein n=1 Tax=uncultured Caudovirales phage TaxID=2100421 RepID=A0A6J5PGS4_9CAUD|nr:hypothetical protein UFOVP848_42 [uncultured Caudovirales phage]CAB4173176.1 hypothetical protein UFOVP945_23 [uncultured Caudovirales phage]CAB4179621.1 hypothetical protein UFOVP1023_19 [uncultured Caudovirales phage]CAB4204342.1 hypothetical protein UFOVP1383_58 [uncultured Caudovirales phage]CAB4216050.1 hypothetical protein UFOVP1477_49 [uncultured Caudovirales phage]